jgi:2-methylcitrate dehydratase PrpD
MDAIRRLAQYATQLQWVDLPAEVIEHGRRILLDTIGTTLGGSVEPEVIAMAGRYGRPDGGPSTLIGHGLRSSPLNAGLVNGTSACWMDFDSGHRPPPGKPLLPAAHPPIHLVPAALAMAEKEQATGRELLIALVVGYDSGARIGMSSRVRPEIHCHGTHHNVAAAVAAARLMKYPTEQMASAIGLAAHLSLMPSFENAYQGGTVRNTYAGVGAAAGILAAQLASIGFTAEKDVLNSVYGGIISPWFDPDLLTEDLGKRFEITLGFIKLYPMCRFGHPAIEAAQKLIEQHPSLQPDEIEKVDLHTFDWAATLNEVDPKTDLAAKFSIPWAVASVLVRRSAGPDQFRTEALNDTAVRRIAGKVAVSEDTQYSAMTPAKRPARIIVRIKGGKVFNAEVERSSGGPDAPLPREKVVEKFRSLADPVLGAEQARIIVEKVMHLEKEPDIHDLTNFLIPEGQRKRAASKP